MQRPPLEIAFEQTLHGYADGHQLLRSSVNLSSAQENQLLLFSDLSGPEFRSGFDGYITGYPLDGSGYYVLARTWFAPEMPRPGCVWTHSLLIRDEDLSRVRSLPTLPFRRPTAITGDATYESIIRISATDVWSAREGAAVRVGAALTALYSTEATVVVPAASSAEFEDDFVAVLLQQWPRLRRTFRFCSGALLPRDRNFDLVASPHDAVLGVERRDGFVISRATPGTTPPWVAYALRDLEEPKNEYREFLWRFGSEFSAGRRAYSLLTDTYMATHRTVAHEVNSSSFLERVGRVTPGLNEAPRFKSALFGPQGLFGRTPQDDALILRQVLRPRPFLDVDVIAVRERVVRLGRSAPETLAAVLELASQDEVGDPIVSACLDVAREDGVGIEAWPAEAIALLVARDEAIASNPHLWTRPPDAQLALFRVLHNHVKQASNRIATALVFFDGRFDEVAEAATDVWPIEAVSAFIAHIGRSGSVRISESLDKALERESDLLARIVHQTPTLSSLQLRVCAAYLDPLSPGTRDIPADTWFRCVGGEPLETRLETRALALMLLMAFRSTQFDGSALVALAFPTIYRATGRDAIARRHWQAIAEELPRPSYGWDNCKWLVRSATEFFVQRSWSVNNFTEAFKHDQESWRRAIRQLRRSYSGTVYLERVRDAHRAGAFRLTEQQSSELHYNPWW